LGEGVGPCPARTRPPARSFVFIPARLHLFNPPPFAHPCPRSPLPSMLICANPPLLDHACLALVWPSFALNHARLYLLILLELLGLHVHRMCAPVSHLCLSFVCAHFVLPLPGHACVASVWPSFTLVCTRLCPRGPRCHHPCCPHCRRPHGPSHGIYIKYIVSINTIVILLTFKTKTIHLNMKH
jgi:hypothetical protein